MEVKRILVPIDGSAATKKVVEWACYFARIFGAEMTLLHVVSMPPVSDISGTQAAARGLEEAGQSILEGAKRVAKDSGVEAIALLDFTVGNAGPRITQIARERCADMIVLGARGQSRIKALLMGSVANHVVNNSPCPVFVVRPCGDQECCDQ